MNCRLYCLLAQGAATSDSPEPVHGDSWWGSFVSNEHALLLGVIFAVVVGLFVWAFIFRKRRPAGAHRGVLEPGSTADDGKPVAPHRHHHRHRRQHRRRHRHSWQNHRNPSLHETGGLPPPRPEDQAPVV